MSKTMDFEVFDAFRKAGTPESEARKAAEALNQDDAIADIRSDVRVLKWSTGVNTALILVVLGKLFFGH